MLIEFAASDNLAATFSTDLVDHWLYVIDVAAGDDIPRKRGLGLVQPTCSWSTRSTSRRTSAPIERMRRTLAARPERPTVYTDLRSGGAEVVLEHLEHAVLFSRV